MRLFVASLSRPLVTACVLAACGSSGSSGPSGAAFAPLFDAPDSAAATPNVLDGLWAGSISSGPFTLDVRLKLAMGTMTFAARCEDAGIVLFAGVQVPDQVGASTITALATSNDDESQGSATCRADIMAQQSFSYQLSGLTMVLTFPNTPSNPMGPNFQQFNTITMTKISD
jgi:hypothetical protein